MFDRVADDLAKGLVREEVKEPGFNPKPAGVLRPGAAPDVVMRLLGLQRPDRWLFHAQIVLALGRSKGEVDYALLHLRRLKLIEAAEYQMPGRSPVYRYRLVQSKKPQ